jgi:hypothetical protein
VSDVRRIMGVRPLLEAPGSEKRTRFVLRRGVRAEVETFEDNDESVVLRGIVQLERRERLTAIG